jgi:predicted N-acetyltransferase YhbS
MLKIRKFKKEHIKSIQKILKEVFNKKDFTKAKKNLIDSLKPNKKIYVERFVAVINKDVIGICGMYRFKNHPKDLIGMGWFALKPEYQRKGIGTKLLKLIEKKAELLGKRFIFVWTDENSVKFYRKNGYRKTSLKLIPKEGNFLLIKRLKS